MLKIFFSNDVFLFNETVVYSCVNHSDIDLYNVLIILYCYCETYFVSIKTLSMSLCVFQDVCLCMMCIFAYFFYNVCRIIYLCLDLQVCIHTCIYLYFLIYLYIYIYICHMYGIKMCVCVYFSQTFVVGAVPSRTVTSPTTHAYIGSILHQASRRHNIIITFGSRLKSAIFRVCFPVRVQYLKLDVRI